MLDPISRLPLNVPSPTIDNFVPLKLNIAPPATPPVPYINNGSPVPESLTCLPDVDPTVIVDAESKVPVVILSAAIVTMSPDVTLPICTGLPVADTGVEVSVPFVVAIFI